MRRPTTAVILAAGMGLRLEEMGRRIPKGFLQLGERPIVEESILRLRNAGMQRVIFITGHLSEHYEALAARYRGFATTIHNPRYAGCGSLESLACVEEVDPEGYLLLESDLIYESRALHECLEAPHDDVILLSGPTMSGDEVYVTAEVGVLTGMSKNRSELAQPEIGELVGISKISARVHVALLEEAVRQRPAPGVPSRSHYETDGLVAVARRLPVHVHRVVDLVWSEIDDPAQLDRARSRIYPAILAADPLIP